MRDGDRLKNFIDNQPKSKISIAKDLNISKQSLFQYFKSKELSNEVKSRFEEYFGKQIFEVSTDAEVPRETVSTDPPGSKKEPVYQIILNLSYQGRRNSDTMNKMAATNQTNTDIIAALVMELLPNSKLAQQLAASPDDPHIHDDLSAEDFLHALTDQVSGKKGQLEPKKIKSK